MPRANAVGTPVVVEEDDQLPSRLGDAAAACVLNPCSRLADCASAGEGGCLSDGPTFGVIDDEQLVGEPALCNQRAEAASVGEQMIAKFHVPAMIEDDVRKRA